MKTIFSLLLLMIVGMTSLSVFANEDGEREQKPNIEFNVDYDDAVSVSHDLAIESTTSSNFILPGEQKAQTQSKTFINLEKIVSDVGKDYRQLNSNIITKNDANSFDYTFSSYYKNLDVGWL
jgi:hypothetical protein